MAENAVFVISNMDMSCLSVFFIFVFGLTKQDIKDSTLDFKKRGSTILITD